SRHLEEIRHTDLASNVTGADSTCGMACGQRVPRSRLLCSGEARRIRPGAGLRRGMAADGSPPKGRASCLASHNPPGNSETRSCPDGREDSMAVRCGCARGRVTRDKIEQQGSRKSSRGALEGNTETLSTQRSVGERRVSPPDGR